MSSNVANITLRLRSDLHDKLVPLAEDRGCSMNEMINRLVEAHFDQAALVDALAARLEERMNHRSEVRERITGVRSDNLLRLDH